MRVEAGPTCPLCLDALTALPQLEVCPDCRSIHHQACVRELGRCGTPGCQGLLGARAPSRDDRTLAALAWACNLIGASLIGPLVIYVIARQQGNAYVRYQARQAALLGLAAIVLAIPTLGLAVLALFVVSIVLTVRSARGEWNRLPLLGRRPPPEAPAPGPADGELSSAPKGAA